MAPAGSLARVARGLDMPAIMVSCAPPQQLGTPPLRLVG